MDPFALADRTARSFALTLRLLPEAARGEVCLAYLLARASDTVADEADRPAAERIELIRLLEAGLSAPTAPSLDGSLRRMAERIRHPGEQRLMQETCGLLECVRAFDDGARERVRQVLSTIFSGQLLDIRRFSRGHPARLGSAEELLDYTWRVAGCVGAFWTDVLVARVPGACSLPASELRVLGIRYGQGLQLLNILRDAPRDWENGRCYLPPEDPGAGPADFPGEPASLFGVMRSWLPQCKRFLDDGTAYGRALNGWRTRVASRLPARLAHMTWERLEQADRRDWLGRVKVSRAAVRRALLAEMGVAMLR